MVTVGSCVVWFGCLVFISTVHPLLLGYHLLLDGSCQCIVGPCVIGWFILHNWINLWFIVGLGICLYVIGFVTINFWLLSVRVLLGR